MSGATLARLLARSRSRLPSCSRSRAARRAGAAPARGARPARRADIVRRDRADADRRCASRPSSTTRRSSSSAPSASPSKLPDRWIATPSRGARRPPQRFVSPHGRQRPRAIPDRRADAPTPGQKPPPPDAELAKQVDISRRRRSTRGRAPCRRVEGARRRREGRHRDRPAEGPRRRPLPREARRLVHAPRFAIRGKIPFDVLKNLRRASPCQHQRRPHRDRLHDRPAERQRHVRRRAPLDASTISRAAPSSRPRLRELPGRRSERAHRHLRLHETEPMRLNLAPPSRIRCSCRSLCRSRSARRRRGPQPPAAARHARRERSRQRSTCRGRRGRPLPKLAVMPSSPPSDADTTAAARGAEGSRSLRRSSRSSPDSAARGRSTSTTRRSTSPRGARKGIEILVRVLANQLALGQGRAPRRARTCSAARQDSGVRATASSAEPRRCARRRTA